MGGFAQPPTEGQTGALANWSALNAFEQAYRGFTPASFALAGSGGAGTTTHMRAQDAPFGLGTTARTNIQTAAALKSFFTALPQAYTPAGSDRASLGVTGELPAGVWNGDPLGHILLAPATTVGGDIHIYGQGAGATTLTLPDRGSGLGCMGSSATLLGGATRATNIFTLPLSTGSSGNPNCQVGDPVVVHVLSKGVLRWAHYTCTANNVSGDYTRVQYNAFAPGMAVDGCIPPSGQIVYFPGTFIQPLNFRNPHSVFFHNMSIESGSRTNTPLDGIGFRLSSGCFLGNDVYLGGWWANQMINGGPMPALLNQGPQNTDHSGSSAVLASAQINTLFLTNTQQGAGANGRVTVGGGRDNNLVYEDNQTPGLAHIVVADDGTMATTNLDGSDFKSGQAVIYGEGVAGVSRLESLMCDCLTGSYKTESFRNRFINDESKTGTVHALYQIRHRCESSVSINGAGDNINGSDQPYTLTTCSVIATAGTLTTTVATGSNGVNTSTFSGSGTLNVASNAAYDAQGGMVLVATGGTTALIAYGGTGTNTLTQCQTLQGGGVLATGGAVTNAQSVLTGTIDKTTHGLVAGLAIQTGNGGPATTLLSSMDGLHFPQGTIHCTNLAPGGTAFPTSGQVLIDSSTGTQLVTYTGITGNDLTGCTGGKTNSIMHTNGGVTSQVLSHETRIRAFDSTGQIITCDLPDYIGPDLAGPATCTMGEIGFIRAGKLGRFEYFVDWNVVGADRYVDACMTVDVNTLAPGAFTMTQMDSGPPLRTSPAFIVRDAQPIGGIYGETLSTATLYGTTYSNVFRSTEVEFSQFDIGKNVTCADVAGGVDPILSFIDVNNVVMTGAVTNHATPNLTWSMSDTPALNDPRVTVRRGANVSRVVFHSGADTNPVAPGNLLEYLTSTSGTLKVRCSIGVKSKLYAGVAITGSPVGARLATSTNVRTGTAGRILLQSAAILAVQGGSTITLTDDPQLITSSGAIAAGTLIVDNGATIPGTVIAWDGTTTGLRVVGQSIKAAAGGFVAAQLCHPWWT